MRTVRADRELELEQELIGGRPLAVRRPTILAANLAELARPIGQHHRLPGIEQRGAVGAVGAVVADPGEPASRELIVARHVGADAALKSVELIAAAPDDLATRDERVIDCAPQ